MLTIKEKTRVRFCAELSLNGLDAFGVPTLGLAEMRVHDILQSECAAYAIDTLHDPSAERYWY